MKIQVSSGSLTTLVDNIVLAFKIVTYALGMVFSICLFYFRTTESITQLEIIMHC